MNVDRLRNKHGQLWLNVASSYCAIENFVNLDNSVFLSLVPFYHLLKYSLNLCHLETIEKFKQGKSKAIVLKHDCRKALKFPKESVDHILCSHFLEHVYPDEAINIIKDFHRVLKRSGTLHIVLPDLEVYINEYLAKKGTHDAANTFIKKTILSHDKKPSFLFRFLEFMGGYGLQHRWMYDSASLLRVLQNIGFRILTENNSPSKEWRSRDGVSLSILAEKIA